MGQIKMADYSNFLSEADESSLQYEMIFCKKNKNFLNNQSSCFNLISLESFRKQHLKVSKSQNQFLLFLILPKPERKM